MGSPFRGLETYRFEHAPIFFGRSEATKTAVEHLLDNTDAERPFLLVLGASGAGKSSLAQAGIVPSLGVRGVVPALVSGAVRSFGQEDIRTGHSWRSLPPLPTMTPFPSSSRDRTLQLLPGIWKSLRRSELPHRLCAHRT